MNLNVIVNAMKKCAGGMPQQPAAGNFVAPQLQSLPPKIEVTPETASTTMNTAATNAGVGGGATQQSDLQVIAESVNNLVNLGKMKQKAETQQQPQATNAPASGATVAQVTGSTPQDQASPAVAGKDALFGLPAKTASVNAAKKVAALLKKQASAKSDFLASVLYTTALSQGGAIGGAGLGAASALKGVNQLGGYTGLGSDPATEEEEEKMDLSPDLALAPGVAAQRMDRRMKRQLLNDDLKVPHFWSQKLSPLTVTLLLAGLGAAGGYGYSKTKGKNTATGTVVGGLGGVGASALAGLGGLALAGLTPTRTKEQQKAYANSPALLEYLIPGLSAYHEAKTLGRSFADSDERAKKRQQKEQQTKKASWFNFFRKADDELGQVHDNGATPKSIDMKSWDPEMTDQTGTEFQFDSSGIEKKIYGDLKKHYAKLLANAYFKSTGKHLANPESKVDPRYQYMLGHASNVDPDVMKKLTQYYQDNIGGWNSYTPNMSPDLIADAVDYVNNRRSWVPLMKGPKDTKEMAYTQKLPDGSDLDLALLKRK